MQILKVFKPIIEHILICRMWFICLKRFDVLGFFTVAETRHLSDFQRFAQIATEGWQLLRDKHPMKDREGRFL